MKKIPLIPFHLTGLIYALLIHSQIYTWITVRGKEEKERKKSRKKGGKKEERNSSKEKSWKEKKL